MNLKCLIFIFVSPYWQQATSDIIPGSVDINRDVGLSEVTRELPDDFEGRRKFDENRERDNYAFDAGNPDIHGEIQRPCQVYETSCIRKFFAEHSHCKISGRKLPDPLFRAQHVGDFPTANITEVEDKTDFMGLNNARISEFYINKVTDNLVIAITFDGASRFSSNVYFEYHLRGREPVVTRDFAQVSYGVLTMTVIIPHIKDLRLERSEIYTYGDTRLFTFTIGPGLGVSTDPEVPTMYARIYTNIPIEYQQEIANVGYFIAANYIQYNICDFGLKLL